uniref:F-box protein 30b n=2 Tax=Iconisemion striatum TaxID=60296 RepID=A0A1A7WJ16_9TELE
MEDHVHCVSCINLRCTVKPQPGISCDLISCPLLCGAGLHSCKVEEHQLLCPMMRVPCLNSGYGCPATLIRNQMSAHLDVCPAGVVCCTMEWNRCPVSCLDYTSYESLSRVVEEVEQLDMALALQDQRTLLKSLEVFAMAPSAQEEPLVPLSKENNEKHSALNPSDSEVSTSFGSSSSTQPSRPTSRDLAKEKILRGINGLNEEHFSKLYEATVETARSLAAALDFVSSASSGESSSASLDSRDALLKSSLRRDEGICNGLEGTTPEGDESLHQRDIKEQSACSSCLNENGAGGDNLTIKNTPNGPLSAAAEAFLETACRHEVQENNTVVAEESVTPQMLSPVTASPGVAQLASRVVLEGGELVPSERRFNTNQPFSAQGYSLSNGEFIPHKSQYKRVKMEDKAVDTSDLEQGDDPMGLGGIDLITAALLFCLASRECRRISDTVYGDGYRVDFGTQTFTFPAAILVTNTRVGDMASASACDHAAPQLAYPSPFRTLLLSLVPEALKVEAAPYIPFNPSYQHTFPFICSQPFRRDQFSSHFRNVHGDIHAGLNGWMEHRCPLAYYGCTFSQRRFYPTTRGAKVVHDRHLKSFGVQPCPTLDFSSDSQSDQLSGLPIEILWHIAGFLDSFSLCQLSLVSRRMREVCASLLQTRGIVELQWELKPCPRGPGTASWQIKNKVWRFSTAFSPVTSWGFTDIPSMSVHLTKCHFNVAEHRTEPVPLPAMCAGRDRLYLRRVLRHVNT